MHLRRYPVLAIASVALAVLVAFGVVMSASGVGLLEQSAPNLLADALVAYGAFVGFEFWQRREQARAEEAARKEFLWTVMRSLRGEVRANLHLLGVVSSSAEMGVFRHLEPDVSLFRDVMKIPAFSTLPLDFREAFCQQVGYLVVNVAELKAAEVSAYETYVRGGDMAGLADEIIRLSEDAAATLNMIHELIEGAGVLK